MAWPAWAGLRLLLDIIFIIFAFELYKDPADPFSYLIYQMLLHHSYVVYHLDLLIFISDARSNACSIFLPY